MAGLPELHIMAIYDYGTLSNLESWANSFLTPGLHLVQLWRVTL